MSRSMPPTSPPAGPPDLAPARPGRADHLRLVSPAGPAGIAAKPAVAKPAGAKPGGAKPAGARSLGDWLWHGLGAGVATASAGFATYALVFSTGEVVPSGNFNLFSRAPLARQAAGAQHAEPGGEAETGQAKPGQARPGQAGAARSETADAGGVDFAPTGSVAGPAAAAAAGGEAAGGLARSRRGPDGPALPNFTLRDVFDGKALVESRSSLSVVKPGSMLDGAGEVLSIEKRGERWIVLTRNGVIAGQRR